MTKKLSSQINSSAAQLTTNQAEPSTPSSGFGRLWVDGNILKIKLDDGSNVTIMSMDDLQKTSFGELSVAELSPVAAWIFNYNVNSSLVNSTTSGTGTVTQNDNMVELSTSAAINSSAKIDTLRVASYEPGVGVVVRFTAIYTTGVAGSSQLVGIGDDLDGYFIGYDGTDFGICRRKDGVDDFTPQSSFSETLNFTLDQTKGNVYQIRFQWLGFGPVTFYVENPDTQEFETMHIIKYPNNNTTPSISNPILPLYAIAENTTNNTDIVVKSASAMAAIEGKSLRPTNKNPLSLTHAAHNSASVTSQVPILSIRNNATYQTQVNRVVTYITKWVVSTDGTKNVQFDMVKNATLVGDSFTDFDSNVSTVAIDTSATSGSGGTTLEILGLQKDGTFVGDQVLVLKPGDYITFYAQSASSNDVDFTVIWEEIF